MLADAGHGHAVVDFSGVSASFFQKNNIFYLWGINFSKKILQALEKWFFFQKHAEKFENIKNQKILQKNATCPFACIPCVKSLQQNK